MDNYPAMSKSELERAPWNEQEVPERDFDVEATFTISRYCTITTNDYAGGEYNKYEGCYDEPDTDDTDWRQAYDDNGYHDPIELIDMLKGYLMNDLQRLNKEGVETRVDKKRQKRLESLIEECEAWEAVDEDFQEG